MFWEQLTGERNTCSFRRTHNEHVQHLPGNRGKNLTDHRVYFDLWRSTRATNEDFESDFMDFIRSYNRTVWDVAQYRFKQK